MIPPAPIRILIVAALAMAALIGLVVAESLARAGGTEVTLRMEAVDPRSLLSGHFVAVSLRETLPVGQACPPGVREEGVNAPFSPFGGSHAARRTTWIALARRGTAFSVAGAAEDRRSAARHGPIVVRGRASCRTPLAIGPGSGAEPAAQPDMQPVTVSLDLGIDRFYVNQAEGRAIDHLLARPAAAGAQGPVQAIVSIGRDGRARMKGLLVEGRRIEPSLF